MPDIVLDPEELARAIPAMRKLSEGFGEVTARYPEDLASLIFRAPEGSAERQALIALGRVLALIEYNTRRSSDNLTDLADAISAVIQRHLENDDEAAAVIERAGSTD